MSLVLFYLWEDARVWLIEIIPLVCIITIQGQYPACLQLQVWSINLKNLTWISWFFFIPPFFLSFSCLSFLLSIHPSLFNLPHCFFFPSILPMFFLFLVFFNGFLSLFIFLSTYILFFLPFILLFFFIFFLSSLFSIFPFSLSWPFFPPPSFILPYLSRNSHHILTNSKSIHCFLDQY